MAVFPPPTSSVAAKRDVNDVETAGGFAEKKKVPAEPDEPTRPRAPRLAIGAKVGDGSGIAARWPFVFKSGPDSAEIAPDILALG